MIPPLTIVGLATDFENAAPKLPLYLSAVQAGWPSPADDYIDQQINLHELAVRNPAATFFLRAAGDSMLGAVIHDGDLLIVDRSVDAAHNRVVIAALDGELLVKKTGSTRPSRLAGACQSRLSGNRNYIARIRPHLGRSNLRSL